MGHSLIVTGGKIKIDIRYFISVKAKKYGKWNIVAIFVKRSTALGTFLIRKVKTTTHRTIGKKLCPMTFGAYVMGGKRIYLRNT